MPLFNVIVTLLAVGVMLYLVDQAPINQTIKNLIRLVTFVAVILWILRGLGFLPSINDLRIGR